MANRTTGTSATSTRCSAVEGGQQCLREKHPKILNHTWGSKGETSQWTAAGQPKTQSDPAADTEQLARDQFTEFTPDPALAAEARRLVAEEQARLAPEGHHSGPLPNENSATGTTLVTDPAEAQREEQRQDRDIQRRTEIAAAVTDADVRDMEAIRASHPDIQRPTIRPDAGEAVLAAAGGVINPAAEPGHAIKHAEEFARLLVVGMHLGSMLQANADKQLVAATDVRAVYRKMRQIAATHGIDLDGVDGGS